MDVPLLVHPESVVLVVLDGDELICVRQTRPGTPERTLELPSGKLEPGELPLDAAVRELAEECGLTAQTYRPLGSFWVVPAYSTERTHIFEAIGLYPAAGASLDADEDIEIERLRVEEAWARLSDGASLAALALWQRASTRSA
jgi:ADP-ribose pyrophosphatase